VVEEVEAVDIAVAGKPAADIAAVDKPAADKRVARVADMAAADTAGKADIAAVAGTADKAVAARGFQPVWAAGLWVGEPDTALAAALRRRPS
jgi:antitoxin (DNA-binding transcriptional repressor) of toxin-antitoxin stability system